jgi:hypothetical protein
MFVFLRFLSARLVSGRCSRQRFFWPLDFPLLTEGVVQGFFFSPSDLGPRPEARVASIFVRSFSACVGLDLCSAHFSAGGHSALGRLPCFTPTSAVSIPAPVEIFPTRHQSFWSSFWVLLVCLSCLGSCSQIWSPCRPYFSFFFCADPARAAVRSSGFLLVP